MVQAYFYLIKGIFNYTGRTNRKSYGFALLGLMILLHISYLLGSIDLGDNLLVNLIIVTLFLLVLLGLFGVIPLIVRRIHDSGIPLIIVILLLLFLPLMPFVLLAPKSQLDNKYGPIPTGYKYTTRKDLQNTKGVTVKTSSYKEYISNMLAQYEAEVLTMILLNLGK